MDPESSPGKIRVLIHPTDRSPEESDWQEECRQLYDQIRRSREVAKLQPLRKAGGPGDRGVLELFHNFVATGVSLGAFAAIYQMARLWLEHRKNVEITLALPNGISLNVSNISYEEALRLYEQHQARFGGAEPTKRN